MGKPLPTQTVTLTQLILAAQTLWQTDPPNKKRSLWELIDRIISETPLVVVDGITNAEARKLAGNCNFTASQIMEANRYFDSRESGPFKEQHEEIDRFVYEWMETEKAAIYDLILMVYRYAEKRVSQRETELALEATATLLDPAGLALAATYNEPSKRLDVEIREHHVYPKPLALILPVRLLKQAVAMGALGVEVWNSETSAVYYATIEALRQNFFTPEGQPQAAAMALQHWQQRQARQMQPALL